MNRGQLKQYIMETYHCEADHPWMKYPSNEVFRHSNNRKWFALISWMFRERSWVCLEPNCWMLSI